MRTCPWPIDLDEACEGLDLPEGADALISRAITTASAMMSRWSGYSVGLCDETLRPLKICPECRSFCCGGRDGIRLQGADGSPVYEVVEVYVDGAPLDPREWRWDRAEGMLWRVSGSWPSHDDRSLDLTECGTFGVDVKTGSRPDGWAMWVATQLAVELVRSCVGDKGCRIPRNATQVNAQGVTIQLSDSEVQYMLPEVSAWVESVNPHHAVSPARILSPEVSSRRRGAPARLGATWPTLSGSRVASGGGCCGA